MLVQPPVVSLIRGASSTSRLMALQTYPNFAVLLMFLTEVLKSRRAPTITTGRTKPIKFEPETQSWQVEPLTSLVNNIWAVR